MEVADVVGKLKTCSVGCDHIGLEGPDIWLIWEASEDQRVRWAVVYDGKEQMGSIGACKRPMRDIMSF
jgi:hypothetical protein